MDYLTAIRMETRWEGMEFFAAEGLASLHPSLCGFGTLLVRVSKELARFGLTSESCKLLADWLSSKEPVGDILLEESGASVLCVFETMEVQGGGWYMEVARHDTSLWRVMLYRDPISPSRLTRMVVEGMNALRT